MDLNLQERAAEFSDLSRPLASGVLRNVRLLWPNHSSFEKNTTRRADDKW